LYAKDFTKEASVHQARNLNEIKQTATDFERAQVKPVRAFETLNPETIAEAALSKSRTKTALGSQGKGWLA